jgi:hypothetical protein
LARTPTPQGQCAKTLHQPSAWGGQLVAQATDGTDANLVIAALLHDTIEDQDVTSETIANDFGQHVADIVMEVADDKSLLKEERKRLQIENAPKAVTQSWSSWPIRSAMCEIVSSTEPTDTQYLKMDMVMNSPAVAEAMHRGRWN